MPVTGVKRSGNTFLDGDRIPSRAGWNLQPEELRLAKRQDEFRRAAVRRGNEFAHCPPRAEHGRASQQPVAALRRGVKMNRQLPVAGVQLHVPADALRIRGRAQRQTGPHLSSMMDEPIRDTFKFSTLSVVLTFLKRFGLWS